MQKIRYELASTGKCPVCKKRIQATEKDGIVLKAKSIKLYSDGARIEARCQCKSIISVKN
jgi:hypothetical protein